MRLGVASFEDGVVPIPRYIVINDYIEPAVSSQRCAVERIFVVCTFHGLMMTGVIFPPTSSLSSLYMLVSSVACKAARLNHWCA